MKKIAVINDISGFGKCSLTVSLPIISSLGVECNPIPTAILSNQTGFDSYHCVDFTENMTSYIDIWKQQNVKFDAIMTGYLASEKQVDIIIDFIDMAEENAQKEVTRRLEAAVKKDRIKTVVVGMTELGLMQVTRKKTRPSLKRQMTTKCRACEGTGRLPSLEWTVTKMRREAEGILANTIYDKLIVKADPRLLSAFAGQNNGYLLSLEEGFGGTVSLESAELGFGQYLIEKEKQK